MAEKIEGIKTVLFDVDNTLYDAECGVEHEMGRRIDRFVSDYLGVTEEESRRLRGEYIPVYGTTLRWLQEFHGLEDSALYMEAIHPENLKDFIGKNRQLRMMLQSLSQELAVFTNGPEFHARRVLRVLGVEDIFMNFFALEHLGSQGKPYRSAYEAVMNKMGLRAEETLFLDDREVNLDTFYQMGGHGILVGSDGGSGRYPVIATILELKNYL